MRSIVERLAIQLATLADCLCSCCYSRWLSHCIAGIVLLGCSVLRAQEMAADKRFDLVIVGGKIVDGSGTPWYPGDIAIKDGKIVAVGRFIADEATEFVDAKGLIVAPGFIDMMGQTATPMLDDPKAGMNLLAQGITTINAGEGVSAVPLNEAQGSRVGYRTFAEYFALLDMAGLPVNVAQTIGHTQVRQLVLGDIDRRPNDEELDRMKGLVREAMEAGAIGVSSALIYPPAVYAPTQELSELSKVAGEYGGRYYTHMRNEGDRLLEAIDEALDIGRTANAPVHIFHLKAAGRQNWSKMSAAIESIKQARAAGQSVAADIYPYINNGLGAGALIHPRHFQQGEAALKERLGDAQLRREIQQEMETTDGWENWFRHVGFDWKRIVVGRCNSDKYASYNGQSVGAISEAMQVSPWDVFFELVLSDAFVLPETMLEANLMLATQQPFISFCTDVGPAGGSSIASHPRASGAFPRLISRYVRQLGILTLEQAIAQATAVAANEIMAFDRGRIAVGQAADVIVFNYDEFTDLATFADPAALAVGMKYVLVNGQVVYRNGEYTGARPGRVLRGPGYREQAAAHHVSRGEMPSGFECYDEMMSEFMHEYRVPGASIAVTDRGQLVFAKGYGYADIAAEHPVEPNSLFRIASISKPITAVAILQLVDQGKLQLDEKVWEVLGWEEQIAAAGSDFDLRQREITIRQLLQHRGGWDRDMSFDAMFQSVRFAQTLGVDPPAVPEVIMGAMLRQPLDFPPGERYAYSNYGYCLLGRVIEKLSGRNYEDYVKENVLAPLGITSMCLGRTLASDRTQGEVCYYQPERGASVFADNLGDEVPTAYGAWCLEAMDAHGGWLATAADIAKFAAAFDRPGDCRILSQRSIEAMFARPDGAAGYDEEGKPKDVYYSLGWNNRLVEEGQFNHWHTGSLPGTTAIVIRRHDGKNFVALLNTRQTYDNRPLSSEIDRLLHAMAGRVEHWPID